MSDPIILASGSEVRAHLLKQAGLDFTVMPVRVDEDAMREALVAEDAKPRDIADALAEMKARRASEKEPLAWSIGCDQVLDLDGRLLAKSVTPEEARESLKALSDRQHTLYSAAVIYEAAKPIWRHVGIARMRMRALSDVYIADYVDRNWQSIRHSVGGYKIEEEGVRLFTRIDGDYHSILGMPLLELLSFLALRGRLAV